MPRGNDKEAARKELADRLNAPIGNASDLINAMKSHNHAALVAAQLRPVNEAATAELDLDDVQAAATIPEDGTVVAAAVRGSDVVYLVELEDGATYKDVLPASDAGVKVAADPSQRTPGTAVTREREAKPKAAAKAK